MRDRNSKYHDSNVRPNHSYAYGMFVLAAICVVGGIISFKTNGVGIYAVGLILIGLFSFLQYAKVTGSISKEMGSLLTWLVVWGLLIVNVILLWRVILLR